MLIFPETLLPLSVSFPLLTVMYQWRLIHKHCRAVTPPDILREENIDLKVSLPLFFQTSLNANFRYFQSSHQINNFHYWQCKCKNLKICKHGVIIKRKFLLTIGFLLPNKNLLKWLNYTLKLVRCCLHLFKTRSDLEYNNNIRIGFHFKIITIKIRIENSEKKASIVVIIAIINNGRVKLIKFFKI